MSSSDVASNGDQFAPDPRRWVALATLLIAGFMNLVDITIVNVGLPSMQTGLAATSSQIEWVVAGYVLAFALGLLPFGRLGDIMGRHKIFLVGVAAFTLMSALCGLAPNIEVLIFARILQGLAGAMMMPQVLAIVQNIFPPEERPGAFAMFGLSTSIAAVAGPLLGGTLISADIMGLAWRPIFLINVPIGIVAVIAGMRLIPKIKTHPGITNDLVGILIASVSVFLLIFPLIEGRTYEWPLWCFVMMVLSLPGFVAFVLWQQRRERENKSQLLPVSLMRNRNFMLGTAVTMGFFSGIPGFFMIVALFLQVGFGMSPLDSGLTTIPFPLGVFVASMLSGRLGTRLLKPRLVLGVMVMAIGMILMRQTIIGVGDIVTPWDFVAPLLLTGFGMGITIAVLFQAVLSHVSHTDAGSASGGLQAFQQMGGAIGVAIIGEIFFSTLVAGGRPDHAAFVSAASNAMIYDVAIFVGVAILALFLNTSIQNGSHNRQAAPVPVEA